MGEQKEKIDKLDKIKQVIDELRDRPCFCLIEDFPEDFVEDRTTWDSLANLYTELYYGIIAIENTLK